ncbi:MAG: translation initiation factor IF-3 [Bacillota bacterium]
MFVNEQIKAREVRVIDPDGNQLGVMKTDEALDLAREKKKDLVNVAPNERPPVCRMMDYGKYKYEQSKKDKEAKKKQKTTSIKEIKLRPNIEKHDFDVKVKRGQKFLEKGDKIKVTVMFRGREITHPEIAQRLCKDLADALSDYCVIEKQAKQEGRNMIMILAPKS